MITKGMQVEEKKDMKRYVTAKLEILSTMVYLFNSSVTKSLYNMYYYQ